MRRVIVPLLLLLVPSLARSAVLSHSGYLLGAQDVPVSVSGAAFTFELFPASTGGTAGYSASCTLAVTAGYYATTLGQGCGAALDAALLDSPKWLEVTVDGTVLAPRVAIAALPAAVRSADTQALIATLGAAGTVNAPGNPVQWTKLTGVPANVLGAVAFTPDASLALSSGTLSVVGSAVNAGKLEGKTLADLDLRYTASGTGGISLSGGTPATQTGSAAISGSFAAGSLVVGATTVDATLAARLAAMAAAPTLAAPADATTVYSHTKLQWAGYGAPFVVELDTVNTFTNPYSVTTYVNEAELRTLTRAGGVLPGPGTLYWRVRATGISPALVSATRTLTYVPSGATCKAIYDANTSSPSGVYWIDPDGGSFANAVQVYCDMSLGGGWTLVFSSQTVGGTSDVAGPWNAKLTTLTPTGSMLNVWTPFASVTKTRFVCDGAKNGSFEVDYVDAAGEAYAALVTKTTGIENFQISLPGGVTLNNNNDSTNNPDFWLYPGTTPPKWGSYDDFPYNSSNMKDTCNQVTYGTRTTLPDAASTSNAYFYIFVR